MLKEIICIFFAMLMLMQSCFADMSDEVLNNYYGNNTANFEVNFSDISQPSWITGPITFLAKYGIVCGNDGMFYPFNNITRDQFVKILVLGFGLYDISASCDFIDVPENSWQYPYIAAAKKLGITSGINDSEFGVNKLITRQQMITLAYNAVNYSGISLEKTTENIFVDEAEIDSYAIDAVTAFKQSGIISGDENNMFKPHQNATRAEACKIIYSIIANYT